MSRLLVATSKALAATPSNSAPAAPDPRLAALTQRELEVARLIAGGASNKEVARALDIAERTVKATDEVSESINAIQSETTTTVQQMKAGTTEVEEGVVLAQGAGESLSAIVTRTKAVGGSIHSILAAAEQQSAATSQVARSIVEITSTARQAAAGAGQAAAATTQLSAKAESLQQIVQRFRVEDRPTASSRTSRLRTR